MMIPALAKIVPIPYSHQLVKFKTSDLIATFLYLIPLHIQLAAIQMLKGETRVPRTAFHFNWHALSAVIKGSSLITEN